MEFEKITIFLNGHDLGFFKSVVINDHEARLYNDELDRVIQFDSMEETHSGIHLYCSDNSNHYYHNGIMAWDIIDKIMEYYGNDVDGSLGFYLGNIFKYLLRFKYKDQAQSDLEKVKVYIDRIMEIYGSLS